jgi:hypothetical protein
MKITKSRRFHVNLGNFEWVEFGGDVTLDTEVDDEVADMDTADVLAVADEILSTAFVEDLRQAHEITDEEDSFVHLVVQPAKKGKR